MDTVIEQRDFSFGSWVRPVPIGDRWDFTLTLPCPIDPTEVPYLKPYKQGVAVLGWAFRVMSGLLMEVHTVDLRPHPYPKNIPFPLELKTDKFPNDALMHRLSQFLSDGWYLIVKVAPQFGGGLRLYRTVPPEDVSVASLPSGG